MAKYINWKAYSPTDPIRIEANLFGRLSSRWYPVNIIGSEVDDIFAMYSQELSSASVQIQGGIQDTNILYSRTSPVGSNQFTPIYNHFGYALGVNKFFDQDYENFNSGSVLMSYRSELRTLLQAYHAGASNYGLSLTGQAFTGIAPVVVEGMKEYNGWVLKSGSGSVAAVTTGGIIPATPIAHINVGILPTSLSFNVGDPFYYSWSKLGINTKLGGSQKLYSGIKIYNFGKQEMFSEISSSVETAIKKVLRADLNPEFVWSSDFAYSRPDTYSLASTPTMLFINNCLTGWNSDYIVLDQEYSAIHTGSISGVVVAPYNTAAYKVRVSYLSDGAEVQQHLLTPSLSGVWDTPSGVPVGVKVVRIVDATNTISYERRISNGTPFLFPPSHYIPPNDALSEGVSQMYQGDTKAAALALLACVDTRNTSLGNTLVSSISSSVVACAAAGNAEGAITDKVDAFTLQPISGSIASCDSSSWVLYALLSYFKITQNTIALDTAKKIAEYLLSLQVSSSVSNDFRAGLLVSSENSNTVTTESNVIGYFAMSLLAQITGLPSYLVAASQIRYSLLSTLYVSSLSRFVESTTATDKNYAESLSSYTYGGNALLLFGEVTKAKSLAARMISKFLVQDVFVSFQNSLPDHYNQTYSYTAKPLHGFRKFTTTTDGETADTYTSPPSSSVWQEGTASALLFLNRLHIYSPEYDTKDYFDIKSRVEFSQDLITRISGTGVLNFTSSDMQAPYSSSVWPGVSDSVWSHLYKRNSSLLMGLNFFGKTSWERSKYGWIYNTSVITSPVVEHVEESITLPIGYETKNWYPDFFTIKQPTGVIAKYLRGYSASAIPPTFPYMLIDRNPSSEPLLPIGATGGLYLFDTLSSMRNLTTASGSLPSQGGGASLHYVSARNTNRLATGITLTGGATAEWYAYTDSSFDLANEGTFNLWLYGFGSTAASSSVIAFFKRTDINDNTIVLNSNGFLLTVNTGIKQFSFSVRSGSVTQTVSASIRMICEEDSLGWHNFVVTKSANAVELYVDGKFYNRSSMSVTPAAISVGMTTFVIGQTGSTPVTVAVDALSLYNIISTPSEIVSRFSDEMPHMFRGVIPSSSIDPYYQAKIEVTGDNVGDAEFHQFSMRGLNDLNVKVLSVNNYGIPSIPIFKSGSL